MTHHCANIPKNVFFPKATHHATRSNKHKKDVAAAQQICEGCPLTLRCYEQAVRYKETTGIWGGINFEDRKPKRRTA